MEDTRWLRLISVGLVLAAMAVGYFLLSSNFFSNKSTKVVTQQNTQGQQATASGQESDNNILAEVSESPKPSNSPAYAKIVGRNQTEIETLPNTGASLFLIGIFSASVLSVGLGLRRFPH